MDRFSGLQRDLDVLVEFGRVCAVEALESVWSSLHEKVWMSRRRDWFVESYRCTVLLLQ